MQEGLEGGDTVRTLTRPEWETESRRHQERLAPWATDRQVRGEAQVKHPVYDFLFEYYSFRPAQLLRWSPGAEVLLEGACQDSFPGAQFFQEVPGGVMVRARSFPVHRLPFLCWAAEYLERVGERPPRVGCAALHEWAMVYRAAEERRHLRTPLRVSPGELEEIITSEELRCTHYDAYRFFTPPAVPRNRHVLTRESTIAFDQPGCIHVTMDLYKFAHKIAPYSSAALIADTFELALRAREIDMRASPYELSAYGLAPIRIETAEGRQELAALQAALARDAAPLRARLLAEYRVLLGAHNN